MNIRRVTQLSWFLLFIFLALMPLSVYAQESDASISNLSSSLDDENLYFTLDIELTNIEVAAQETKRIAVVMLGAYSDSGHLMLRQSGERGIEGFKNNAIAEVVFLEITTEDSFFEGVTLVVPKDNLPKGTYEWHPLVVFSDTTKRTDHQIAMISLRGWYHTYQFADFSGTGTAPEESGIHLNKIQYVYDDEAEYLELHLDLEGSGFSPDEEMVVLAMPTLMDGNSYIASTDVVPGFNDGWGDIANYVDIEINDDGSVSRLEAEGNEVILRWPVANFPEGSYTFYPHVLVGYTGAEGTSAFIHDIHLVEMDVVINN